MSFYVTLTSDTSNGLSTNKQNEFTTFLTPSLNFTEPYEVAVTDFSSSMSLDVDIGTLKIEIATPLTVDRISYVTHKLQYRDNLDNKLLCEDINRDVSKIINSIIIKILTHIELFPDVVIEYMLNRLESVKLVVVERGDKMMIIAKDKPFVEKTLNDHQVLYSIEEKELNSKKISVYSKFNKQIELEWLNDYERIILPGIDTIYDYFHAVSDHIFVQSVEIPFLKKQIYPVFTFTGLMARIMTEDTELTIDTAHLRPFNYFKFPQKLQVINQFLIYTDIIEEQYYGGRLLPILHTLNLNNNSVAILDTPHYLTINKSSITSINIRICDRTGEPIRFSDKFSNVLIKLHFRKKQ